eukprot:COSAG06_NODE_7812_length_2365_cov_3.324360_4_plen_188_part_01
MATVLSQLGRGGGVSLRVLLFFLQDGARQRKSRGGRREQSSVGACKGKGGAKQSGCDAQPHPNVLFSLALCKIHSVRTTQLARAQCCARNSDAAQTALTNYCRQIIIMFFDSGKNIGFRSGTEYSRFLYRWIGLVETVPAIYGSAMLAPLAKPPQAFACSRRGRGRRQSESDQAGRRGRAGRPRRPAL